MGTTFRAVPKLATVLVAALALMALPAAARAADSNPDAHTMLGPGAGYASPQGSHQVRRLQRRLELAGEQPGPLDGLFGPRTEAAVVRFQLLAGLVPDGIAGPLTHAALRKAARTLRPGAGYAAAHGSARVRSLQRALRLAGSHPGPVDGRFGPRTEAAVLRFQRVHGLATDGLAGDETLRALGRMRTRVVARNPGRHRHAEPVAQDTPSDVVEGRKARAGLDRGPSVSQRTVILALAAVLLANVALLVGSRALSRRRPAADNRPPDTPEREGADVSGPAGPGADWPRGNARPDDPPRVHEPRGGHM
jgi:peptidoglycan hydrolase-like protein with peptidoglycan-binding domain